MSSCNQLDYYMNCQSPCNRHRQRDCNLMFLFPKNDVNWLEKNMDVYNEHETIQHYTCKVKEQRFYCCSVFHSHSRVFNNEQTSYPKMSVQRSLEISLQLSDTLFTADKRYIWSPLSLWTRNSINRSTVLC